MSNTETEMVRFAILDGMKSKIKQAEEIGSKARKDAAAPTSGIGYERQAAQFLEGMARAKVGGLMRLAFEEVEKDADPVAALDVQVEWFTDLVLSHGDRVPSDVAARAFMEVQHQYLIEALKELRVIQRITKRHLQNLAK